MLMPGHDSHSISGNSSRHLWYDGGGCPPGALHPNDLRRHAADSHAFLFQSHEERKQLIRTARVALDEVKLPNMPIVAGVGAPSTRESIELAKEAADAGADFVMVIPPGYYAGALLSEPTSIKRFFLEIAEASPVPVSVRPLLCLSISGILLTG